jgi:hypothetical protein
VQKIAVSEVQLDGVEADAQSALCRIGESRAHARHVGFGRHARRVPAGAERERRRPDRRPRILRFRQRLAALPRALRGSLASGVGKLNRELCLADAVAMVDYALQGRFAGVGIKSEATVGDPAMALDRGGLDHQERGAGICQHAQMGHVPVVGDAVISAVLAHR